jgi:hypothetical protein
MNWSDGMESCTIWRNRTWMALNWLRLGSSNEISWTLQLCFKFNGGQGILPAFEQRSPEEESVAITLEDAGGAFQQNGVTTQITWDIFTALRMSNLTNEVILILIQFTTRSLYKLILITGRKITHLLNCKENRTFSIWEVSYRSSF